MERRTGAWVCAAVAVLLWLPPLALLARHAHGAAESVSPTDWRYNHRLKQDVIHMGLLVCGLPPVTALLGAAAGAWTGRAALRAAVGLLAGVLLLWAIGVFALVWFLTHVRFHF